MAHVSLTVQPRSQFGSAATRRLRREGLVPGVLYQKGAESVAFSLVERELRRLLHTEGIRTQVIDVHVGSGAPRPALFKEWHVHPVRGDVLHVDMAEVDLTKTIQAPVAVNLVGTSSGVREGGVLDQSSHTVTVEALPDALPESLELDVTELEIGGTLHVSDLSAPEGVTIIDDPDTVLASVTPPSQVEAPEAEEGMEGVAEGEMEPEVIGESAEDEE